MTSLDWLLLLITDNEREGQGHNIAGQALIPFPWPMKPSSVGRRSELGE